MIELALAALMGALAGAAGAALLMRGRWSRRVSRLSHDLRGALSPALLMAERLEAHPDPKARQAGEIIAQSIERAANRAKQASQDLK